MKKIDSAGLFNKLSVLKDNPKALAIAAICVFLLDGFILVYLQFMPLAGMWKSASQMAVDIQQAKQDSKSKVTFKTRLDDLKTELANLEKRSIPEEELPKALETISKFADVSSVKILKIRPMTEARKSQKQTKITKDEVLTREKISITAMAGFHQLGRFVALLENSPVFLDIRKVEIRGDGQEYMKHSVTIFLDVVLRKS